jgi:hypothetical protein
MMRFWKDSMCQDLRQCSRFAALFVELVRWEGEICTQLNSEPLIRRALSTQRNVDVIVPCDVFRSNSSFKIYHFSSFPRDTLRTPIHILEPSSCLR